MRNKNIKLVIFGSLFKDTIVTTFQNLKKNFSNQSVFNSSIRVSYGGIYNIYKEKKKKEKWFLLSDAKNKIKKNNIFLNFKSIPHAIILENLFNHRLSFVKKGVVKSYKKLQINKDHIFLGFYLENLPIKIVKNFGKVIFDFNSSGEILDKKVFKNNFSKIDFLLGSANELNWIKNFKNSNKNITIIEHSPKEVIVKNPFNKKKNFLKINNKYFIKNSKKTIGLGDMFALQFARNIQKNLSIEKNIRNIQLYISNYIKKLN
jgi:hypothetical protein